MLKNILLLHFFKFTSFLISKLVSVEKLSQNLMKPEGFTGKCVLWMLNISNKVTYDYLMTFFTPQSSQRILDIGFGSGILFHALLSQPKVEKLFGIDFSTKAVELCSKRFRKTINTGKLEILEASIERLPYSNDFFHTIFTCNTLYFWPNPAENAKEIYRTLKPNGMFIMGFSPKEQLEKIKLDFNIFKRFTIEEVVTLVKEVGFKDVKVESKPIGEFNAYALICIK